MLQNDLDKHCDWEKEWLIHFNISKCKHLKYGTTTSPYKYLINDGGSCSRIDVITSEKDLGVWITSKPDITLHCDSTSSKLSNSLG